MGRVECPGTGEPFPDSPGLVVLCRPQRLLLRSLGGSCSDGRCPHFLGTPVLRTHSCSLRACWLMQAASGLLGPAGCASGQGGLRGSDTFDQEAGGHSVGSGVGAGDSALLLPLSTVPGVPPAARLSANIIFRQASVMPQKGAWQAGLRDND